MGQTRLSSGDSGAAAYDPKPDIAGIGLIKILDVRDRITEGIKA
jgi:hypothetical protein